MRHTSSLAERSIQRRERGYVAEEVSKGYPRRFDRLFIIKVMDTNDTMMSDVANDSKIFKK